MAAKQVRRTKQSDATVSTSAGPMRPRIAARVSAALGSQAGSTGPGWKPAKSSVSGNYGQAVSAAAKARNQARKSTSTVQVTGSKSKSFRGATAALGRGQAAVGMSAQPTTRQGRRQGGRKRVKAQIFTLPKF